MEKRKANPQKFLRFLSEVFLAGALLAAVSYHAIPGEMRYLDSRGFGLLWLTALASGICTTPAPKYTLSAALGILVIPLALDFLMAYRPEYLMLILALCLLGAGGYTALAFRVCLPQLRRQKSPGKWLRFLHHHLFRSRTVISAILALWLAGFGICSMVSERPAEADPSAEQIAALLDTMDNRTDLVVSLENRRWNALPADARLSALQQLADIECAYLGIPEPVTVATTELGRKSILGCYSHQTRTVYLNQWFFETTDPSRQLRTLLHEVYHAYQFALLDLYAATEPDYREMKLFEKAPAYSHEFTHYISGGEDYAAYAAQAVEADSNAYAELRLQEYLTVLTGLTKTNPD